ncbi:MAG: hypothetical protein JSU08_15760 [Acidobacteria bacterium]|nr:hypothetical protein [Acidobacteriota bacterium]
MRHFTTQIVLAALAVATVGCGDVARNGRSPVYLVMDSLGAIPGGASDGKALSFLNSDVQRIDIKPAPCSEKTPCPTTYADAGQAVFHLAMKDIGTASSPTAPTTNNQVTITRYHVVYRRADGRNTQGVDVPYAFDGAATITVPASGTATLGFELVRNVAKMEAPLVQLITNPQIITTLADVTFYGQDQVGNEIQVTGSIQVDFGNFADR